MDQESQTPRTDEEIVEFEGRDYVPVNFCRALEIELREALERLEKSTKLKRQKPDG